MDERCSGQNGEKCWIDQNPSWALGPCEDEEESEDEEEGEK